MNKNDVEMLNTVRRVLAHAVYESEHEAQDWAKHWGHDSPGVETSRKYADRIKAASDWFDALVERMNK